MRLFWQARCPAQRRDGLCRHSCNAMASQMLILHLICVSFMAALAQQPPPVPGAVLQPVAGAALLNSTASQEQCVSQVAMQLEGRCAAEVVVDCMSAPLCKLPAWFVARVCARGWHPLTSLRRNAPADRRALRTRNMPQLLTRPYGHRP